MVNDNERKENENENETSMSMAPLLSIAQPGIGIGALSQLPSHGQSFISSSNPSTPLKRHNDTT